MPFFRFLVLGIALTLSATVLRAGCLPLWPVPSQVTFATDRQAEALADLNGDGISDLIVGSASNVSVLITDESVGKLGDPVTILTGTTMNRVAAADVNGDGNMDVIVGNTAATQFTVVPGNGDGTFSTPVLVETGTVPTAIFTGDFNRDGNADVGFRSHTVGALVIQIGDGKGGFAERSRVIAPAGAYEVTVADLTSDAIPDLLVKQWEQTKLQLLRGHGDGTFAAPAEIALPFVPHFDGIADFDGDGDLDLALSVLNYKGLYVLRNDGSGAFPGIDHHSTSADLHREGYLSGLSVADVTQDGFPDIVTVSYGDSMIATFAGRGDGTFESPLFAITYVSNSKTVPSRVMLADFTGDGRKDALYRARSFAVIVNNNCGDNTLVAKADTPVITAGDAAQITASIQTPWSIVLPQEPPVTGTLSLFEDTSLLLTHRIGSGMLPAVQGLALGVHSLLAEYSGSDRYHPSKSAPFTITVTNERTTTTLSTNKTLYTYGDPVALTAITTAADGTKVSGTYRYFLDGVWQQLVTPTSWPDAGEHQYQAQYMGDGTHPASMSPIVVVRVEKAPTTIDRSYSTDPAVTRYGETVRFAFGVTAAGQATGSVDFYDGSTKVATAALQSMGVSFDVSLPIGRHVLTAKYQGGPNHLPSQTTAFEHTVVANEPVALDAYGRAASVVAVWVAPSGAKTVLQRFVNGAWSNVVARGAYEGRWYEELNPVAGTAYVYRVQAFDANDALLGTSSADSVVITSFTSDPLVRNTTRIAAAHLQEIVSATNVLRAAAGLAPVSLPNVAPGKRIAAADFLAIRSGIQNARVALTVPNYPFTNSLGAQTPIRAADVQELRDALR
jgi:hypothetical protein